MSISKKRKHSRELFQKCNKFVQLLRDSFKSVNMGFNAENKSCSFELQSGFMFIGYSWVLHSFVIIR